MNERLDELWQSRKHRWRRPVPGESPQPVEVASSAAPPAAAEPVRQNGRLWLTLLLFLAGSFAVSFVVSKAVLAPSVPAALVGTWKVTAGELKGATLEFRPDGGATAVMFKQGKKAVTHSTAKVEGKTLLLTTRDDKTGKEETVPQLIVELTADELVLRDEDQVTYHMKRIPN